MPKYSKYLSSKITRNQKALYVLGITLCVSFFLIDSSLSIGVAFISSYFLIILITAWLPQNGSTHIAGAICSLLIITGFWFSNEIKTPWIFTVNRILSITMIWVLAWFVIKYKKKSKEVELRENNYTTLFKSITEGLLVIDAKAIIRKTNNRVCQLLGYNSEELIGQSIEILISEKTKEQLLYLRKEFKNKKKISNDYNGLDFSVLRKDGSVFPVEFSVNRFTIDDELMNLALLTDITVRKKVENELKELNKALENRVIEKTLALEENKKLYKLIANNFPNGVINILDRNLNYVFVEETEFYKNGITGDVLDDTSFLERIDVKIRDVIKGRLMQVFKGKDTKFELKIGGKTYMMNAVGLSDRESGISRILVVSQNISEYKREERNIQLLLKKEIHLNELKSRFVSMASHEFRTPLTTIMNSVSLLSRYIEKDSNKEKLHSHIHRIRTSVYNLTDILNDFLSLDKLEEGKVGLHNSEFNLPEFIKILTENVQSNAKENQQIEYTYNGPTHVTVDKQILRNILNNLLSNAIKYSSENSVIYFKSRIENEHFIAEIRDNGIGIPKEEQKHVFERFFRAQNALNIQGTGLGLNIVKKYLNMVNGSIEFQSDKEKGTVFTLKMPVDFATKLSNKNLLNSPQ